MESESELEQRVRQLARTLEAASAALIELSRVEEALRRSEERFRQVAESAVEFIWEVDADGLYLYASGAVEQILGYKPEEIVGRMHFYDLFAPETREETKTAAFEVFSHRQPFRAFLNLNLSKNGRIVALETNGFPILDGNGGLFGYRGADMDITDRKRADDTRREGADRLARILEATSDGVWDWNIPSGDAVFSPRYARMLGYEPEEFANTYESWRSLVHPDDINRVSQHIADQFDRHTEFSIEFRMREKSGNWHWIHSRGLVIERDAEGRPVRMVGTHSDIQGRKRAEEALRENEQRLLSTYNTVEDAIFHLAVEPEGQFRILSVNAAFLRVTGLSQEMVVGKTVNEFIPEPSLTMVTGKYRQAIEEKTLVEWEETSDYPAGRLTGEVSITPIFDNTGTCTHLVGSVHDITEIKHAQEIENRLASDLEHSRDEIRALAASLMRAQEDERRRISRELHDHICHQLGSLAVDIGKLTVGPQPSPENVRAKLEEFRARVVKTSQETQQIAHQMHTAILDDLGLVASLEDLCSQFSEQYPNIALDCRDSGPPASLPSETATCLYRVAEESLENIAKHSRAKRVSVRLDFRTGGVTLTIRDDGAGFDPKAIKGHGRLGLISMEERAHLVKGKLTIASQPGHGTKITLEIPLQVSNS